jgi:hypothetical protein
MSFKNHLTKYSVKTSITFKEINIEEEMKKKQLEVAQEDL